MDIDTPRTDRLREKIDREWDGYEGPDTFEGDECLDLAENLERENTKLRETLEKFRGQFDCYECTGTAEDTLDSLANKEIVDT
tara:strand:+ start:1131 stop:1379 length:249 start_codon:yes stop_codon:yes gene_type:complete